MRGYSALQHGDVMLIAQRDAAEVALHTYVHANASALCALKAELCVPGLLAAHNFSLATLTPGTVSVVRPAAFCIQPHLQARLPEWLSCGRAALAKKVVSVPLPLAVICRGAKAKRCRSCSSTCESHSACAASLI